MAKSIRSKRKKKFRAILREEVYMPVVAARLEKCLTRLHQGSKVIEVPRLLDGERNLEEPSRFSFAPFFHAKEEGPVSSVHSLSSSMVFKKKKKTKKLEDEKEGDPLALEDERVVVEMKDVDTTPLKETSTSTKNNTPLPLRRRKKKTPLKVLRKKRTLTKKK
ncbi:hypothetical protein HMI54_012736 [Coelomomyces lativittatus]|nr:hypothetical protein HMI56_007555 [Coelomomyces lativittatus]KAJ1515202.1 hypothetical protein HMI54_012736 [Coelomomyces lativittatus]KAJ1516983.1 hypothetical protein HMI55_000919 [Coelomomyces lativittatus]